MPVQTTVQDDLIKPIEWFREWRDPVEFTAEANAGMDELRRREVAMKRHELFLQNRWRYLQDVHAAGLFATILNSKNQIRVKLADAGSLQPDFYIEYKGKVLVFELTECDDPARERGREYREHIEGKRPALQHEDPDEDIAILRTNLPAKVRAKVAKKYEPKRHLLVYVNLWLGWGGKPPVTDIELQELTAEGRNEFHSVWLLWRHLAIQTWPGWKWLQLEAESAVRLIP